MYVSLNERYGRPCLFTANDGNGLAFPPFDFGFDFGFGFGFGCAAAALAPLVVVGGETTVLAEYAIFLVGGAKRV